MQKQLSWTKELLEKHPKTKKDLEQWVLKQLQQVQSEMASEAGVTDFPKIEEEKAISYVPFSLAGNPDYYFQFFDENKMYVSIVWEKNSGKFVVFLQEKIEVNTRQEATIKAVEILFEEYERTKV
jgi:hypothetical protein